MSNQRQCKVCHEPIPSGDYCGACVDLPWVTHERVRDQLADLGGGRRVSARALSRARAAVTRQKEDGR